MSANADGTLASRKCIEKPFNNVIHQLELLYHYIAFGRKRGDKATRCHSKKNVSSAFFAYRALHFSTCYVPYCFGIMLSNGVECEEE